MLEKNFYDHDCFYLHLCEGKTKQEAREAAKSYSQHSLALCQDETNKPKIIERRVFEIRRIAQALHHATPFGSELYDMMSEIVFDICILEKTPVPKVLSKSKHIIQRYEMIIEAIPQEHKTTIKQMIGYLMKLNELIILLDLKQ